MASATIGRRGWQASALLPVLLLAAGSLNGCVAAAIPVVASGVMAKRVVDPATDRTVVAERPAARQPKVEVVPGEPPLAVVTGKRRINRAEDFVTMALFAIDSRDNGLSVVPDPAASAEDRAVAACDGQPPAILVDLDPGETALPLDDLVAGAPPLVAPGLIPALNLARAQGLAVLWTSVQAENRDDDVRRLLAASGLDPARADLLLLIRDPAETKTDRRKAAARDYCIKAIVGDRRGDFDELLNYLRDPAAPTPFDPLFGKGWFDLPPPIEEPAA